MNGDESLIWPYQTHFRIAAESAARSIFDALDSHLKARVLLIGVPTRGAEDALAVCVDPEDADYNPRLLAEVRRRAEHFAALDEGRWTVHSHPIAQQNHERAIEQRSIKSAIQQILDHLDEDSDRITFCSLPTVVAKHYVCTVLQVNRRAFESYYSLSANTLDDKRPRSLLHAIMTEFFIACTDALMRPDPGATFSIGVSSQDLIRAGGQRLMQTVSWATLDHGSTHSLFASCDMISSLFYEGIEGVGQIYLAKPDHPNIEALVTFKSMISIHDHRAVRKMLQMSSDDLSLFSDGELVYGLGRFTGFYDYRTENFFIINFVAHYTWELIHAGQVMMHVRYGQPQLPKLLIDKAKFKDSLQRIFRNLDGRSIEYLWKLVLEATRQKHGTMLVVSDNAQAEAARLETQSTLIEPVPLIPAVIPMVTAIDGAILLSPSGICYAIGVILDGLASARGDPSRGSRYNSAIRYVESTQAPCLAIVVSADGTVDLIPDLPPRIKRSSIENAISRLRVLASSPYVDERDFRRIMNWLKEHQFYLLPEACREINDLRKAIEPRLEKSGLWITYPDFSSSEEMNESYLSDD